MIEEQGDYALDRHFINIIDASNSEETTASNILKSKSFELVHSENSPQSVRKCSKRIPNTSSQEHYRQEREMTSIVGTYQHESNENLDEYFKAVGMLKATKNECGTSSYESKNKYLL